MRNILKTMLALLALAFVPTQARAVEYPCTSTVRIIVALPAGSTTSVIARLVAEQLALGIGRPVVVENYPGADSAIGARRAFESAADGCTLFMMTNGVTGIEPRFGPQAWDPERFVPIAMVARSYQVLVVDPAVAGNFGEFVDYVRKYPGTTFGRAATSGLIACSYFAKKVGLTMTAVHYSKGGDPAMVPDLLSGRITSGCPFLGPIRSYIAVGSLRALAILGPERFSKLPDIPAITEVLPGSQDLAALEGRSMLVCPPGCPETVVRIVSQQLRDILARPEMAVRFRQMSSDTAYSTPDELRAYIGSQVVLFRNIVDAIGLTYRPQ